MGVLPHSQTPLDKARWDRSHACFEIRIVPTFPWDMDRSKDHAKLGVCGVGGEGSLNEILTLGMIPTERKG